MGMSGPATPISAVICTRRRPAQAVRALRSLCAQVPAVAEILVIDNDPADATLQQTVARDLPQVRYVCEPKMGLNVARNRALREARMPLVAFLDDDAVADAGWAAVLAARLASRPQLAVCTGRVEALELATEAQRLFEANGGFSRGSETIRLPEDAVRRLHGWRAPLIAWAVSVGNGANVAIRHDVLTSLGGFDEALDGVMFPGGGDLDAFWRVLQSGYELQYEPAALVYHEHRRELSAMADQLAIHQKGVVAFLCKALSKAPARAKAPVLSFLVWRLMKPGVRLARRAAMRDPLPAWILWRMAAAAYGGLWSYMLHGREQTAAS